MRRCSNLLAVVSVFAGLIVVGCVGRELDEDEAAKKAVERSSKAWAQDLCAQVVECGCTNGAFDEGRCVDEALDVQREFWARSERAGLAIDEDCLQRRLDAFAGLGCGAIIEFHADTDRAVEELFDDLRCDVYVGDTPIGSACEASPFTSPCENGAECRHVTVFEGPDSPSHVCQPIARLLDEGERCGADMLPHECAPELVCDDPAFDDGRCVRVAPGESCLNDECGVADDGRKARCEHSTNTCELLPDLGEPCRGNGACGFGSCREGICVEVSSTATCVIADDLGLLQ